MAEKQERNAAEQEKPPAQAAARNTGPAVELSFALQMGDDEPKDFTLKGTDDRITIGRKPTSDFVLTARSVSFDHCELFLQRKGRDPLLTVRDVSKNMTGVRSARASYHNDAWVELRKGEIHVLQHLSELRVPYCERSKPDQAAQAQPTLSKIKVIFSLPDAYCERTGSGRWQYIEKLGEGGLAVVYRAKDRNGPLQHMGSVAVKISKFSNLDEVSPQNRHIYALHREAQWSMQRLHATTDHRYRPAGAALFAKYLEDNTGFVEAHSSGDFDTDRRHFESPDFKWDQKPLRALARRPYVVMELVKGKLLQAAMDGQPPLTHEEKTSILKQCAEAFAYMEIHGVIHRDFRGCNLFLQERGPQCKLKVIDLGFMISLEPKHLQATNSNSAVRCAWQGDPTKKLRFDWAPPEVQPKGSCNFGTPGCSFDAFSLGVLILKLLRGRQWAQDQLARKCSGLVEAQSEMNAIGVPFALVERLLHFKDPSKRPTPQMLVAALVRDSPLARKRKQAPAVVAKVPRQLDRFVAGDATEPRRHGKTDPSASASPISSEGSSPAMQGDSSQEAVNHVNANDGAEKQDQINAAEAGHVSINDSNWTPLRSSGDDDDQHSHANPDDAVAPKESAKISSPTKEAAELPAAGDSLAVPAPMKVNTETPTDTLNQIQSSWRPKVATKKDVEETESSNSSDSESSASRSPQAESMKNGDAKNNRKEMRTPAGSRSRSRRGRDRTRSRSRSRRRRQTSRGRRHRRHDSVTAIAPVYGAMQCPPWGPWQDPSAHGAAMAWCAQARAHAAAAWMGNYWPNVASSGHPQGWMAETSRSETPHAQKSSNSAGSRPQVPPPPPMPPPKPPRKQAKPEHAGVEQPKSQSPCVEPEKPRASLTSAAAARATARCKASTKAPTRPPNGDTPDLVANSKAAAMTAAKAVAFARPKASRFPPPPPPPRRENANSRDRDERENNSGSEREACVKARDASENSEPALSQDRRADSRPGRKRGNDRHRNSEWSPQRRTRRRRDYSRDSRDSPRRESRPRKAVLLRGRR